MEGWSMGFFIRIRKMAPAVKGPPMLYIRALPTGIRIYAKLPFLGILNVRPHSLRCHSVWISL